MQIIITWIACGMIAGALTYRVLQRLSPTKAARHKKEDLRIALLFALGGPIGLVALVWDNIAPAKPSYPILARKPLVLKQPIRLDSPRFNYRNN